jgi:hypothetical protein
MNYDDLVLSIVDGDRRFEPGELLVGSFAIPQAEPLGVKRAELSVLWHTTGKGDEDFGVHRLFNYNSEGSDAVSLARRRDFRTRLPAGPLSYRGIVVSVHWCVRLRLIMTRGRQRVFDLPFWLGNTADAQPAGEPAADTSQESS